mmetsp:Transcript_11784/g.26032  ORF Transcript_11784/g.26032 Transcript_11784/m.26032 type:complete len:254 (+) Transcript_11784:2-763(+)
MTAHNLAQATSVLSIAMSKLCAVIGIGPGIGENTAKKFAAEGYAVALMSRTVERIQQLASQIPGAKSYACDVANKEQVAAAFASMRTEMGEPDVVIYNSGMGVFKTYDKVTADEFRDCWEVNTLGLFHVAQEVGPSWTTRGSGVLGVTGATANWRGMPATAAFAPAKAAQRSLAQSLARDLGPKGIHVYNVVVDGVIDLPRTREWMPDKPNEYFIQPSKVADVHHQLASQDASCWTFELNVVPSSQFGSMVSI